MKYKATQKDRYGNMKSLEITMDNQLEVPPMTSAVPEYDHPGEPRGTDTVPAWLTPGEFVVNKEATDMYGPLIKQMNDEGRKIQDMKPEYAAEGIEVPKSKYDAVTEAGLTRSGFNIEDTDFSKINQFDKEIIKTAMRYELDPEYLKAVLYAESSGNPNAIGDKNLKQKAYGLGQLRKNSYNDIKKDFPDYQFKWETIKKSPIANIDATAKYLTMMRDKYVANANKGIKGFKKGFIDNPNEQMNYMYQFYNAGPYKKNATAAMNANKVMEIKERLEGTDSIDPGFTKTLKEKYGDVGVEMPPSVDGGFNFSDYNPIPAIKEKAGDVLENLFNRDKFEIPKPSGIFDRKSDGGKVQHLDPGGMVYNTLDDKDDIMKLIFESQQLSDKTDDILGSIQLPPDDSTSMSSDMSIPPVRDPIAFGMDDPNLMKAMEESDVYVPSYDPQGLGMPMADPAYIKDYERMVQDELTGSPEYQIPEVMSMDPQGLGGEEGIPEVMPASFKPNMLEMDGDILSNINLPTDTKLASELAEKQKVLDMEMKYLTYYRDIEPDAKALEYHRGIVNKLQDQIKSIKGQQGLKEFREDYTPMIEGEQQKIQDQIDKDALEKVISSDQATETEKTTASQALDDLNKQTDTTEEITSLEESQSKLAAVANNLNNTTEKEIDNKLNSDAGQAATNTASQSTGTAAYEQAKGVLNFLFGDLIDSQELGRGIAIYLASRALGYDHNDTIGYVAKNYLKRVDTKNALMDKFIKENAGKYTKKSLSDYKRTGDPKVLIPIGSSPRPQGEEKTYYNAAGQARTAYKFKKKNAQGDDFIYYSWDKDGGDIKQRVSSAWTADGSDVQGTDEYDEKINKAADRIVGKMKSFKEGTDKTKEKNIDKGIMQNVYKTDIEPEFAAREVAAWADANGFQVYEMGPGIQQAWTMAIAAADEAEAQGIDVSITSLIPYLEEATIKQRLDNLKGVPPVSTARVNGNKIEMNPSELVILNGKIKNVTGDVNRFWNTVAKVYKGNDKESGTPWRKIFEQHVIDSGENITPFALFGQVYLENIMEGMANQ